MQSLEDMRLALAGVHHRLGALEEWQRTIEARLDRRELASGRGREAADVAKALGLPRRAVEQGKVEHRRKLADGLRGRGWSYQQIAHALGCSERTVERYFSPRRDVPTG